MFIAVEGVDGAGKGTQISLLNKHFADQGHVVLQTREPGGTAGAEQIRALLVEGAAGRWSAETELLLMYAARQDHVETLIKPALMEGNIVLCDRFHGSSFVYQGVAGGLGMERVQDLDDFVLGGFGPDLELVIDLPVDVSLARASSRAGQETRFESKGVGFLDMVRRGFHDYVARKPQQRHLIDGRGTVEDVHERILDVVRGASC